MFVDELVTNKVGKFKNSIYSMLPQACPYCGEPIEITVTLEHLYCRNVLCRGTQAYRLQKVLERLEIESVAQEEIVFYLQENNIDCALIYFSDMDLNDDFLGDGVAELLNDYFISDTLSDCIRKMELPCDVLKYSDYLNKMGNTEELFSDIEENGVTNITDKTDLDLDLFLFREVLQQYKQEICDFCDLFYSKNF